MRKPAPASWIRRLLHVGRYMIAFLQRDDATMRVMVESAKGKPLTEDMLLIADSRRTGLPREVETSASAVRGSG